MTLSVATPITGGVQTGMAAPSFTIVQDGAVNVNSRRYVVTAVADAGSVAVHTPASPFYVEVTRPAVFKLPALYNALTGIPFSRVGKNAYRVRVLKGCTPAGDAGSGYDVIDMDLSIRIPAGTESNDAAAIRAALSLLIGFFNEASNSAGLGDTLVNSIL